MFVLLAMDSVPVQLEPLNQGGGTQEPQIQCETYEPIENVTPISGTSEAVTPNFPEITSVEDEVD